MNRHQDGFKKKKTKNIIKEIDDDCGDNLDSEYSPYVLKIKKRIKPIKKYKLDYN